jgi:hypothetical protein
MAESKRLKGLNTLREFGLPTPDWQEVMSPADIGRLNLVDTTYGWTIRTCRNDGRRETGGFFINNLSPQVVREVSLTIVGVCLHYCKTLPIKR